MVFIAILLFLLQFYCYICNIIAPTFIFFVLLVANIQCEKGYYLMNDEDENAKEIYDFFKGSGLTSEFFDLTKK